MRKIYLYGFSQAHVGAIIKGTKNDAHIIPTGNINKIVNIVESDDIVFIYNYHQRRALELIGEKCTVYPSVAMSKYCSVRCDQAEHINTLTNMKMLRRVHRGITENIYLVNGSVYKVGNSQQGDDKYMLSDTKSLRLYNDNLVVEEYIEGRSIRVLIIEDSVYLIEHINDSNWIKNRNPQEVVISKDGLYPIITDALKIREGLVEIGCNSPTWGFDYVVGESKTGLLELNDMCGLPDDKEINDRFIKAVIDRINVVG